MGMRNKPTVPKYDVANAIRKHASAIKSSFPLRNSVHWDQQGTLEDMKGSMTKQVKMGGRERYLTRILPKNLSVVAVTEYWVSALFLATAPIRRRNLGSASSRSSARSHSDSVSQR
jgi:hypothetical protein